MRTTTVTDLESELHFAPLGFRAKVLSSVVSLKWAVYDSAATCDRVRKEACRIGESGWMEDDEGYDAL